METDGTGVGTGDEHSSTPKNGGKLNPTDDLFRRKCLALKKKCDSIESDNKKLLNRIYHVRKTINRVSRERRGLMKKLNELKDSYKTIERTTPLEDGPFMYLLGFADPAGHETNIKPIIDPRTAFPTVTKPKINKPSMTCMSSAPSASRKRRSKNRSKTDREKDPNAPKKPANAFLMYCQERRLAASLSNNADSTKPDMTHADLTKQLAKEWNDLDEMEKRRYYIAYEKEKAKYVEEVRQYSENLMFGTSKSLSKPGASNTAPPAKDTTASLDSTKKFTKESTKLLTTKDTIGALVKIPAVKRGEDVDPYSFDGD